MKPNLRSLSSVHGAESALREALAGRRLICEIGVDREFRSNLLATWRLALAEGSLGSFQRTAEQYPALFAAAVAVDAVFAYEAGDLWGRISLEGASGSVIGRAFTAAIARLQLETFPFFDEQSAARYVSRILAHGGIPVYCLGDLFGLVHQVQARGVDDAQEIIEILQEGSRLGIQIDRPVLRFLCSTGKVGADFLQRLIELPEEAEGAVSTEEVSARLGLPTYVVAEYRRMEHATSSSRRTATRLPRARLVLDRASREGPELWLPPVPAGNSWRILHESGDVHPMVVLPIDGEGARVPVAPAARWRASLDTTDVSPGRSMAVGGVGRERPALVFRGDTGELVSDPNHCPCADLLVLAPCALAAATPEVEVRASWGLEAIHWNGWMVHEVELRAPGSVSGSLGFEKLELTLARQWQPDVRVGNRVADVTTFEGHPVLSGPPEFTEVPWNGGEESRWLVTMTGLPGGATSFVPAASPAGLSDQCRALIAATVVPLLSIKFLGPMGGGVRMSAAIVPGLTVGLPVLPLFPSESAEIPLTADSHVEFLGEAVMSRSLQVTADRPRVHFSAVGADGASVELSVRCPTVRWRLLGEDGGSAQYTNRTVRRTFHPDGGRRAVLHVDIGSSDTELSLLVSHGDLVEPFNEIRSSGPAVRLDLSPAIEHAIAHETLTMVVVLEHGGRSCQVAEFEESISLSLTTANYEASEGGPILSYGLSSPRALAGRAIRLLSLDRPWARPALQPITGAGSSGELRCSRLRPGRYAALLVLSDIGGGMRVPPSSRTLAFSVPWPTSAEAFGEPEDERELLVEAIANGSHAVPTLRDPRAAAGAAALLLGADQCNQAGAELLFRAVPLGRDEWFTAVAEAVGYGATRSSTVRAAVRVLSRTGDASDPVRTSSSPVPILRLSEVRANPTPEEIGDFEGVSGCPFSSALGLDDIVGWRAVRTPYNSLVGTLRELRRIAAPPLSPNGRSRGLIEVRTWGLSPKPDERNWIMRLAANYPLTTADLGLLPDRVAAACRKARAWLAGREFADNAAVAGLHVTTFEAAAHLAFGSERKVDAAEYLASVAKTFPEYVESRLAYFIRGRVELERLARGRARAAR